MGGKGLVSCFRKQHKTLQGLQIDSFRKQTEHHFNYHIAGDGQFPLQGLECQGSYWTPIGFDLPCDCEVNYDSRSRSGSRG